MHIILLSGGSGKRLWPLSNDIRSKQFLKLFNDSYGHKESMVQRVYRQICEAAEWESITVAAGAMQKDQLEMQLPSNVNIVIEPERRDTFPAIALACTYLFDKKNVDLSSNIAVLPVDAFVEVDFFKRIRAMEDILDNLDKDLVLLGSKPVRPSEKYGYIIPKSFGNKGEISEEKYINHCFDVEYFKEKPDLDVAEQLIKKGALWNCGVFGLKLGYVLDILSNKYGVEDYRYENMSEMFDKLIKTSFDYEVVEKAKNLGVIKYEGEWKDLGTWETLTEEIEDVTTGNVVMDQSCHNTHIYNELEIPIVTMGIQNSVVVASNDGILVAEKGETYKLKQCLEDIKERPKYEEKRWGKYIVLEYSKEDDFQTLTKKLWIDEGKRISYQYHKHRKEIWTIVRGKGELYFKGEKTEVAVGNTISIEREERHAIKAITNLEIIEIQIGDKLEEEDIVRLTYNW